MSDTQRAHTQETLRTVFLPVETDRNLTTVAESMGCGREELMQHAICDFVDRNLSRAKNGSRP